MGTSSWRFPMIFIVVELALSLQITDGHDPISSPKSCGARVRQIGPTLTYASSSKSFLNNPCPFDATTGNDRPCNSTTLPLGLWRTRV
eukprot:2998806-Amphidinium_carterae.1